MGTCVWIATYSKETSKHTGAWSFGCCTLDDLSRGRRHGVGECWALKCIDYLIVTGSQTKKGILLYKNMIDRVKFAAKKEYPGNTRESDTGTTGRLLLSTCNITATRQRVE
jgi:hypothetical protein